MKVTLVGQARWVNHIADHSRRLREGRLVPTTVPFPGSSALDLLRATYQLADTLEAIRVD